MSNTNKATNCPKCGAALAGDAPEGLCPRCLLTLNLTPPTEIGLETESPTASAKPAPPSPAEIAPHFPQLEIIECLGRGGMGAVYKARQKRIDRLVALKILAPERQGYAQFTERFQREARALARLNHPNIVTLHDFGEAGGFCYLLMEFVEGVTLRQLIQQRKLAPTEALAIVPKICDALQFAHSKGIVHRDIKPENILLAADGQLKIADFGIAKLADPGATDPTLTGVKEVVGTLHYMAPEQAEKPATVDHRADIFSMGVVIYEMLTGELPLGRFTPPSRKVQVDVRLDEIVLRTLEKEPELRYQHASQVKTDLETIAPGTPANGLRRAPPHPSVAGKSIVAWPWLALGFIVLLAATLAWWRAEGNAMDAIGANHGLTPFGIRYAPGVIGQAFDFEGEVQRINIADNTSFRPTSAFTVELWVYPRQFSGTIFQRGDRRGGLDSWTLWTGPGDFVMFQIANASNEANCLMAPLQLNQWQHLAAIWSTATGNMELYVNGRLVGQKQTALKPILDLDPGSEPAVGIGNSGGTYHNFPFNGLIDEPAVYSRALSAAEIAALHAAGKNSKGLSLPPTPSLVINGGFETPKVDSYAAFSPQAKIPGWVIESGTVEIVGSYWPAAEGRQSLDLNGIFEQTGTIYQDLPTTPGWRYRIRLAYASNPECDQRVVRSANIFWNGTLLTNLSFSGTGRSKDNIGWIHYETVAPATEPVTRLRLQSTSPTCCGLTLDEITVSLVTVDSTPPQPTRDPKPARPDGPHKAGGNHLSPEPLTHAQL